MKIMGTEYKPNMNYVFEAKNHKDFLRKANERSGLLVVRRIKLPDERKGWLAFYHDAVLVFSEITDQRYAEIERTVVYKNEKGKMH